MKAWHFTLALSLGLILFYILIGDWISVIAFVCGSLLGMQMMYSYLKDL